MERSASPTIFVSFTAKDRALGSRVSLHLAQRHRVWTSEGPIVSAPDEPISRPPYVEIDVAILILGSDYFSLAASEAVSLFNAGARVLAIAVSEPAADRLDPAQSALYTRLAYNAELIDPTSWDNEALIALLDQRIDAALHRIRGTGARAPGVLVVQGWLDRRFALNEVAPTLAVHGCIPELDLEQLEAQLLARQGQGAANEDDVGIVAGRRSVTARSLTQRFRSSGAQAFVVLSQAAATSQRVREVTARLLAGNHRVVVLRKDSTPLSALHPQLQGRLSIDFRAPSAEARNELAAFLPLDDADAFDLTGCSAFWSQAVFSERLASATNDRRRDLAAKLVHTAAALVRTRSVAYSAESARRDLGLLRSTLQFELLVELAEAAVSGGISDASVARQWAQGLIEAGQLGYAEAVLRMLEASLDPQQPEHAEVIGLRGRVDKQRYVNAVRDGEKGVAHAQLLCDSIADYYSAYAANPSKNLWHGVNALSLLQRAERDQVVATARDGASLPSIAGLTATLLQTIENNERAQHISHWDAACAAEACLVSGDFNAATHWLKRYVHDPATDAFSLRSTLRQFREVHELERKPQPGGEVLLQTLTAALQTAVAGDTLLGLGEASDKRFSFLIRAADASWTNPGISGLKILSRLGELIACEGTEASMRELASARGVMSIQRTESVVVECNETVPLVKARAVQQRNPAEVGTGAVVAIVDSGIDVRHRAFMDSFGKTRIECVWDQTDDTGTAPAGFSFGSEHSAAEIDAIIANSPKDGSGDAGRWGPNFRHGTHVASIAAGRACGANFNGGVAPEATLVVVIPKVDGTGDLGASYLTALSYIDQVAGTRPVVVNISMGVNTGAHDGRSPLEQTFDKFLGSGSRPGRVVVKSAGNERTTNGHAYVTVSDQTESLDWQVSGACPRARIELWFSSGDQFRFRMLCADDASPWVEPEQPRLDYTWPSGDKSSLLYVRRHRDNGDSQLVIELSSGTKKSLDPGPWRLEIRSVQLSPGSNGSIHAWIERPGLDLLEQEAARRAVSFTSHTQEEMTLSIPGTARDVITVGACGRFLNALAPMFTSYGPTRDQRQKPDVCAPGVGVTAAKAGTIEGVVAVDGTSQAAPHVTGAIALLMARLQRINPSLQVNAAQLAKALTQTTRSESGAWNRGAGYGLLDVEALFKAFD